MLLLLLLLLLLHPTFSYFLATCPIFFYVHWPACPPPPTAWTNKQRLKRVKRNEFAASNGLSAFQKEVAPDTSLRRVVEARVRAADKGAVFKVMVDGELLGPFQEIRCACALLSRCRFLCCAAFVLPLSWRRALAGVQGRG
jgi:hypothetical protein